MKRYNKATYLVASCLFSLAILTGCNQNDGNANVEESDKVGEAVNATIVEESSVSMDKDINLLNQEAYFNGFSSDNLAEFKMIQNTGMMLRVLEVGKDLKEFLINQPTDESVKLNLSYQESENGITHPIVYKIEIIK